MILAALRVTRHLPVRRLVIRSEGWVEPCRTCPYGLSRRNPSGDTAALVSLKVEAVHRSERR
jgi:hypothetical protein